MNRDLRTLAQVCSLRLVEIDGGGLRNAIPRESTATVLVDRAATEKVEGSLGELERILKQEYSTTDPKLSLAHEIQEEKVPGEGAGVEFSQKLLRALYSVPNGIYRLSPDVEGLVQTSSNLARVKMKDGHLEVACLVRGSVDSEKADMAEAITCALEQIGLSVERQGDYPGWAPKPGSQVVQVMEKTYSELFGEPPHIMACHAGLECGILGQNYPDMEMISFGPNIRGAHSPDERVQVSSVQKVWRLLLETLAKL
jgi:dipeptidase D